MTRLELISELGAGRREFRALDLSGLDLSGLNLSNCDFRRSNLNNANLSYSNLSNCILVLCDLTNTSFVGSVLDGINFEMAINMGEADFSEALYEGVLIDKPLVVDELGGFSRAVSCGFIQVGCLIGGREFWEGLTEAQLRGLVDEASGQVAVDWMHEHLPETLELQQIIRNT